MWEKTAFVHTPGDTTLDLVPSFIERLVVQVAWGTGPPEQPIPPDWLERARARFQVCAWAWCDGRNNDAEIEARWHRSQANGYAAFVANMEEAYDAHGNSSDPRYTMPSRYLAALDWQGPLGLTTTATFGSDMTAWVQRGAIVMPQAFTLENGATLTLCVEHMKAWGWPIDEIRPLIQSYPTNGARPDTTALNAEALRLGVGGIPFTVEQAMDPSGQQWMTAMRPTIERAQGTVEPPAETDAQLALAYFNGSFYGRAAFEGWGKANPGERRRWYSGDYDPDHFRTNFGKFLCHLTRAASP